jgi:hypothetical protein
VTEQITTGGPSVVDRVYTCDACGQEVSWYDKIVGKYVEGHGAQGVCRRCVAEATLAVFGKIPLPGRSGDGH